MKKIIYIFIICLFIIPTFVYADTYKLNNTDLTINLDESWYVATRDNIKDNKALEEINVTYEYMSDFFNSNQNIHIDALKKINDTYLELFVYKDRVTDVTNLSLYTEEELKDFSKEVSNTRSCDNTEVFNVESSYNKETYSYVKCTRKIDKKYLIEYLTVINNDLYLFQFNKETIYNDNDVSTCKNIIENAYYNVKKRTNEEDPIIKSVKGNSNDIISNALIGALIGGVFGGISGFIFYTLKKKRMNNKDIKNNR